jgi:ubiquinone/menaquinone biosynthesis C-methylase UbiE
MYILDPGIITTMKTGYKHSDHFRVIAPQYHYLRMTNVEPIDSIVRKLQSMSFIHAADIGCGTGRYTSLLLQYLQDKCPLIHCIDYSHEMLQQLQLHFAEQVCEAASAVQASSFQLPLKREALNCIFTFNAIHHFGLSEFLDETARILQPGGYLFVYSRLRSQNSRNIWGRHFPLFAEKETRLYELNELEKSIKDTPGLILSEIETFQFQRESNLAELEHRARNRHYSTLDLYSPDEFETALQQFARNLNEQFLDPNDIQWVDENILLTVQKTDH